MKIQHGYVSHRPTRAARNDLSSPEDSLPVIAVCYTDHPIKDQPLITNHPWSICKWPSIRAVNNTYFRQLQTRSGAIFSLLHLPPPPNLQTQHGRSHQKTAVPGTAPRPLACSGFYALQNKDLVCFFAKLSLLLNGFATPSGRGQAFLGHSAHMADNSNMAAIWNNARCSETLTDYPRCPMETPRTFQGLRSSRQD